MAIKNKAINYRLPLCYEMSSAEIQQIKGVLAQLRRGDLPTDLAFPVRARRHWRTPGGAGSTGRRGTSTNRPRDAARLLLADSGLHAARHGCESITDDATSAVWRPAVARLLLWRFGRGATADPGARTLVSTRLHRRFVRCFRLCALALTSGFHTGQNPFF